MLLLKGKWLVTPLFLLGPFIWTGLGARRKLVLFHSLLSHLPSPFFSVIHTPYNTTKGLWEDYIT